MLILVLFADTRIYAIYCFLFSRRLQGIDAFVAVRFIRSTIFIHSFKLAVAFLWISFLVLWLPCLDVERVFSEVIFLVTFGSRFAEGWTVCVHVSLHNIYRFWSCKDSCVDPRGVHVFCSRGRGELCQIALFCSRILCRWLAAISFLRQISISMAIWSSQCLWSRKPVTMRPRHNFIFKCTKLERSCKFTT